MKKSIVQLILVAFTITGCKSEKIIQSYQNPHYEIDLAVDPQKGYIAVKGTLMLNSVPENADSLGFYIDKGVNVEQFTINKSQVAIVDTASSDNRFLPNARKVYFKFPKDFDRYALLVIQFAYEGKLSEIPKQGANRIGENWTELGLYIPWFPFNYEELGPFTYSVNVKANQKYTVFGIGNIAKENDLTNLSSAIPTNDIVVCLSEDIQIFETEMGNNRLKIFHKNFPDTLLSKMSGEVIQMFNRFNSWFGAIDMDISIIETQRIQGGGYARIGGLVLSGINPAKFDKQIVYYHQFFAHELAHLWWHKASATTWHDWLNESFAEYSSLMSLKETFGQDTFDQYIAHKNKILEGTPPVWELDRNNVDNEIAYQVLYNKGPLLLNELESKIGNDKFCLLCNSMIKNGTNTTEDFIKLLAQEVNPETAKWFEELLRTR